MGLRRYRCTNLTSLLLGRTTSGVSNEAVSFAQVCVADPVHGASGRQAVFVGVDDGTTMAPLPYQYFVSLATGVENLLHESSMYM